MPVLLPIDITIPAPPNPVNIVVKSTAARATYFPTKTSILFTGYERRVDNELFSLSFIIELCPSMIATMGTRSETMLVNAITVSSKFWKPTPREFEELKYDTTTASNKKNESYDHELPVPYGVHILFLEDSPHSCDIYLAHR